MSDVGQTIVDRFGDSPVNLRMGVVSSVIDTRTCWVLVGGDTTPSIAYMTGTTSNIILGAAVWMMEFKGSLIIFDYVTPWRQAAPWYRADHGLTGTTSGTTASTIVSIPYTVTGVPGYVLGIGHALISSATVGDQYECFIDDNNSGLASSPSDRININASHSDQTCHPVGFWYNDGATDHTYALKVQRTSGTGSASYVGTDPRYGLLHTVFFPYR